MPKLIQNIQGQIIDNLTSEVILLNSIIGEVQQEDYIDINGLIAYLQNFKKIEKTSALTNPFNYGLKNKKNLPILTLNIDY